MRYKPYGVQLPTRYVNKYRAWCAGTDKIRGPHIKDFDDLASALIGARDLYITHLVVWC